MAAAPSARIAATVTTPWRMFVGRASRQHKADVARWKAYSSLTSPTLSQTSAAPSPSPPRFSYHIAASFIGKGRHYDPSSHVFHFNPYNRIQPARTRRRSSRPDSGHDAFFVSRIHDTGAVAFGVADGVSAWADSGVNPADFSHGICDHMAVSAHTCDADSGASLTARRLMQQGYDAICNDRSLQAGSSTACVGVASPDGTVDMANLGDSGFLQLRLNAVNAYSEPQTHAFNTPFQLSLVPPRLAARTAAFGGAHLSDHPRDADATQLSVRHGDILILATDGVLDNLFRHDILKIASRVMVSSGAWQRTPLGGGVRVADTIDSLTKSPSFAGEVSEPGGQMSTTKPVTLQSLLATEIVGAARAASINTKVDGPFAKEMKKYHPLEWWRGGKIDDICVLVAVVSEDMSGARSKL
ncbi:hypothetical protein E4U41_006192 [Claviceps citrina]|nr:hypothetical protein E4U41_006192 [Claviceps citrina]